MSERPCDATAVDIKSTHACIIPRPGFGMAHDGDHVCGCGAHWMNEGD